MVAEPKALLAIWEGAISVFYPAQCPGCGAAVGGFGALCPLCWNDAEFVGAAGCEGCGAPVPAGLASGDADMRAGYGGVSICDACASMPRRWGRARAALVYRGTGRRLALTLKHGDRADLAVALGRWLADAAAPLIQPGMVVVPVPIHPKRLLRRRYNQAALLAAVVARRYRLPVLATGLRRVRHTPMQDRRSVAARFDNQRDAVAVPSRMGRRLAGRPVLLVDDVMASGATLIAASDALWAAGVASVDVVVLARAVRDG